MSLPERWRQWAAQPLWSLGFRPFFLTGAAFACIALMGWGLWLHGLWNGRQPLGGMLAWHRHEMLFGFAVAIIAGFLLTAVANWTGRPGLSRTPLILLWLAWLLARLAWWLPLPAPLFLVLQVAFMPALAGVVGYELWRAGKRDNYPIVVILGLLALFQGLALWGLLGHQELWQRRGELGALWLVATLMTVIGGRVIPFFIQRGLNLPPTPAGSPWPTRLLLVGSLLAALSMALGGGDGPQRWLAPLFVLLAALHLWRLWRWHHPGLWRLPLLWSLYLAYLWLALATLGMALWHLGWPLQQSLVTHALAVGGLGGLVLAMVARVSLGHSGRPLQVSRAMAGGFALLFLAAVCRVLLVPFNSLGLGLSALLAALAFALFVAGYGRILLSPRL
ncbi:NnrS family protein [Pseudomonas protegens]|uniref:NnrS family protein n=1 Tax=Pseudomonas protegens TaxID=380021 RepID=A0A7G8YQ06_9PSED|nr:NnrS family protein [Pseudomonas protegens]QNH77754.1 NnrS family protein [Pseudomonas protegens]QNL06950.1 NnrS family protein [Pseudomonas protegens]